MHGEGKGTKRDLKVDREPCCPMQEQQALARWGATGIVLVGHGGGAWDPKAERSGDASWGELYVGPVEE